MKKERKNLWSEVQKINWKRKLYNAFPYHTDVQPIPSTLSFSKLHTPLEGILPSYVELLASTDLLRKVVPRFSRLCA
jgi:hypothetical protein